MNETPITWYARLGGRKFLICAFVVLTATAMRGFWPARLTESGYITLVTLVVTIFAGANVTQKRAAAPKETPNVL